MAKRIDFTRTQGARTRAVTLRKARADKRAFLALASEA
jgi:hypothetical protein